MKQSSETIRIYMLHNFAILLDDSHIYERIYIRNVLINSLDLHD